MLSLPTQAGKKIIKQFQVINPIHLTEGRPTLHLPRCSRRLVTDFANETSLNPRYNNYYVKWTSGLLDMIQNSEVRYLVV